ncbi:helix-turn-helix domain-containing protein [Eoetvoesiella caeni]|nr:helix-turn-helix domain-containing protein [Eoetvoesiella caeni]MCI2810845.1 helix-turn-helix domain-containing protein [Eoetvoesiella caeni]NYT56743.1 helix-turn-helix domain-containing protein [Eoetvoesiella caeni]
MKKNSEPKTRDEEDAGPMSPVVLQDLGKRLRKHRLAAGLTLEKLAGLSGFNKGYLSRIENGKKVPPIATLARLAGPLGIEVASLLSEPGGRKSAWRGVSVVRHGEKRPTILGGSAFGYDYFALSNAGTSQVLQAFLFSFPEAIDKYVFFEHEGEEILHVLTGRIEWQVGMHKYELGPGDTVHFDARMPHRGHSLSGGATALVVMYSPTGTNDSLA